MIFQREDADGYLVQVDATAYGVTLYTYRPGACSTRYAVALSEADATELQLALAADLHARRREARRG